MVLTGDQQHGWLASLQGRPNHLEACSQVLLSSHGGPACSPACRPGWREQRKGTLMLSAKSSSALAPGLMGDEAGQLVLGAGGCALRM